MPGKAGLAWVGGQQSKRLIIVTDLTRFKNPAIVCLAGVDPENGQCIRPTPYLETQSEAEQRLLVECNLQEQNLFRTRQQRLDDAYRKRAAHIAYEEPAPYA